MCYCCRSDLFVKLYEDLVGEPINLCEKCLERVGACLAQGYSIENIHIKLKNKLQRQRRRNVKRKPSDKPRRKKTNRKEYF